MPNDKQKPTQPHEATRKQIARFLPDALAKALTSYREFTERDDLSKEGSKNFSLHHTACKAALAHIELLLKLAKWAHLPDAAAADHNQQILISTLMQEASAEIREMKGENDNEEGGD